MGWEIQTRVMGAESSRPRSLTNLYAADGAFTIGYYVNNFGLWFVKQ
jgi:hypothetical protein